MSRRVAALKPQLNRIRAWAYEGSTDAWIAHQLETTSEAIRAFRQEHGIERGGPAPLAPITPDSVVEAMLAEEAAAAEAGTAPGDAAHDAEPADAPARSPRRRTRKVAETAETTEAVPASADEAALPEGGAIPAAEEAPAGETPARGSRRRGARGGASRSIAASASEPVSPAEPEAEETTDSEGRSEEEPARSGRKRGRRRGRGRGRAVLEARLLAGSVLLLDPAVTADAAFQEHWQDAGPLRVEVGVDAIVLRRAGDAAPDRS